VDSLKTSVQFNGYPQKLNKLAEIQN